MTVHDCIIGTTVQSRGCAWESEVTDSNATHYALGAPCCSLPKCWYPLSYGYSVTDNTPCMVVDFESGDQDASTLPEENAECVGDMWCTFKHEYSGLYIFALVAIALIILIPCFMRFVRIRNRNRGLALGFDGLTGSTTEFPSVAPKREWRAKHMEAFRAKLFEQGLRYARGDIPPPNPVKLPTYKPGAAQPNKAPAVKKVPRSYRYSYDKKFDYEVGSPQANVREFNQPSLIFFKVLIQVQRTRFSCFKIYKFCFQN